VNAFLELLLFDFAAAGKKRRMPQWRVRESHPAVKAYETPMSTGPPAILFLVPPTTFAAADTKWRTPQLQVPVSSRAGRPYESQLGTCRTCRKVESRELRVQSCRIGSLKFDFDDKSFQNREGEAPAEPKHLKTAAQQELRPPK